MPTKTEVEELLTCSVEIKWKEGSKVDGFKFIGSNGNSIYMSQELRWTSTLSDYVGVVNNTVTYDCVYPNPWLFNSYDGIEFFGDSNKKYYRFRECVIPSPRSTTFRSDIRLLLSFCGSKLMTNH